LLHLALSVSSIKFYSRPVDLNIAALDRIAPMSEYPSTSLNKAGLKFRRQGRKKSQNVSADILEFFLILFGKCCRFMRDRTAFRADFHSFAVRSPAWSARRLRRHLACCAHCGRSDCVMSIFIGFI
jgi:hypothetical protein